MTDKKVMVPVYFLQEEKDRLLEKKGRYSLSSFLATEICRLVLGKDGVEEREERVEKVEAPRILVGFSAKLEKRREKVIEILTHYARKGSVDLVADMEVYCEKLREIEDREGIKLN